jgi:electron transport complex protein RnfD
MNLLVSPPPFIKREKTTQKVLWNVILAMIPAVVAASYLFQLRGIGVIVTTVMACVLTESIIQKASGKKINLEDGTAIITGLVLALLLPFNTPLWIPVIGAVFSIGLVKEAFGGHGHNIFNPAIAAWIFLMVSWATFILTPPIQFTFFGNFLLNHQAIRLVEASPAAVLLGGLFLFSLRQIKLDVPVGFLLSAFTFSLLTGIALGKMLSGLFILFLFFVITDPVTSPITKRGRLVYGIACGLLVVIYANFANFGEGLGLSLLLMNALVPLIDRYTKPSPIMLEGFDVE